MKITRHLLVFVFLFLPGILIAAEHFDGTWHTKVVCPDKGKTLGFTWNFDSVVTNSNLRGVKGTEGQPSSFVLEGKIKADGSAKLSGSGIIGSKKYARGVFNGTGDSYNWEVKAQFKDTEGSGMRNEGLGIVGRPCTFEFVKQQDVPSAPAQ
jgi:hypothetical protein